MPQAVLNFAQNSIIYRKALWKKKKHPRVVGVGFFIRGRKSYTQGIVNMFGTLTWAHLDPNTLCVMCHGEVPKGTGMVTTKGVRPYARLCDTCIVESARDLFREAARKLDLP